MAILGKPASLWDTMGYINGNLMRLKWDVSHGMFAPFVAILGWGT